MSFMSSTQKLFLSLKQSNFPKSNIWKNKECFLIMITCCFELNNKRKCNELGREKMSDDFMELNDMELNYIYFGDEMGSDETSNNTKCRVFLTGTKEVYSFYFNILTETFVLNLCSFNIAENANILETAF